MIAALRRLLLGLADDLGRDTRYALRMCARSPGFTLVAVLTLALGIGANTAIFSVVRAVVLRPLPYPHADRLVEPFENVPAADSPTHKSQRIGGAIVDELIELRARSHTFSHVVSANGVFVTMIGSGDSVFVSGAAVTPGTFEMLGVAPALGRPFTPNEEASADHIVMLSDPAWRKYFQADPHVVGRRVTFSGNTIFTSGIVFGTAYTIVGVMPRGFHYPWDTVELWVPGALTPTPRSSRPRSTWMCAQLAPGTSIAAARAEMTGIIADLRGKPEMRTAAAPPRFELLRLEDEIAKPVKPALVVLSIAVGLVLLIACANVTNLLLARMAARQREMAVRAAIGASGGRLARQTLTESLVLALMGGAAGVALAFEGVALFRRLGTTLARFDLGTASASFPNVSAIAVDRGVLSFAVAASVGTGLLLGCLPAVRTRLAQTEWLRQTGAAGGFGVRRGRRMRSALLVAQIGMAMSLFVMSTLLIRSFINLATLDPGYDATHVLTFQVGARDGKYSPSQVQAFAEDVTARLRASPQVVAAGYARQLPMVQLYDTHSFSTRPPSSGDSASQPGGDSRYVSAGYMQAIGARLVAGRWPLHPRDVLVNETLARREFGDASPLGRDVFIGGSAVPDEVVGVVADERLSGLDREPPAQFFADLSVWAGPNLLPLGPYYAVRTAGDPDAVLAIVRDVVRQIDNEAPIYNVATLEAIVANSVTVPRMYAVLLGLFAAIAVGLAAIGIYGVVAYTVAERTREIGIRMALGARRTEVLALVLRQCGALTASGLLLGVAGAAAGSRYLEGLLFGISAFDGATVAAVGAAFAALAIAATIQPARRATRVEPAVALRCE